MFAVVVVASVLAVQVAGSETSLEKMRAADPVMQLQGLTELSELGLPPREAVPRLIELLGSESLAVRYEALLVLGKLGPAAAPAVPMLARLTADQRPLLKIGALQTLRSIGPAAKSALPEIKSQLSAKLLLVSVPAARALVAVSDREPDALQEAIPILVQGLSSPIPAVRSEAAAGLGEIGAPAISQLTEATSRLDATGLTAAADAFSMIGPEASAAAPTLIRMLDQNDAEVRWHALRALGAVRSGEAEVVAALQRRLEDPDAMVRAHAAAALGKIGGPAQSATAALAARLTDPDERVQLAAARALGEIGPSAANAIPALVEALHSNHGPLTIAAADALGQMGPAAVPQLRSELQKAPMQSLIAAVLGRIGPPAQAAVPDLVALLKSDDRDTRREAFLALAAIGPAAKNAIPALMQILQTSADPGRAGAAYALGQIRADEAVSQLRQALNDPQDDVLRIAAAWALIHLGALQSGDTDRVVPILTGGLDNDRPLVRREAAAALGQIGPSAKSSRPKLLELLEDAEPEVRAQALMTLVAIGGPSEQATQAAVRLSADDDPRVRIAAAQVLGHIGPPAKEAVQKLQEMARSSNLIERTVASWALVQIVPTPDAIERAIPLMISALQHPRPEIRAEAARTLGRIGGNRPDVQAALKQTQQDENEQVRQAAEDALRQAGVN